MRVKCIKLFQQFKQHDDNTNDINKHHYFWWKQAHLTWKEIIEQVEYIERLDVKAKKLSIDYAYVI